MVTHTTRNNLAKSEASDNYQTTRTGNNSNADLIDQAMAKCNFTSATDPTANEDSGDGYAFGSVWHNTTAGRKWVCKVATVGAAVWWQVAIAGVAFDFGAVEVRALTFQSDRVTGSAPFTVASTTKVTNLNADMVGGIHIPLTADSDFGSYQIKTLRFESDQATGTAPIVVASTTKVANLNVDLLNGLHDTDFVKVAGTVGLSADWDAGSHRITAETIAADVATGTAPLVVASTTKVANLNADKLDDLEGAAFAIRAGQSGGQALTGGTGSGDDLELQSTSHGTKGDLYLNNASIRLIGAANIWCMDQNHRLYFDQVNNAFDIIEYGIVYISSGATTGARTSNAYFTGPGNLWLAGNCSALTFTDRTPGYDGDALSEIENIKNRDGKIDHATLPEFVRSDFVDENGEVTPGRDIGGMVSVLTAGIQQLKEFYENAVKERDKKIDDLVTRLEKLEAVSTKR